MDQGQSRLGFVIRRLFVGVVLGLIAGLGWMSAKLLIEGIHPLDRWYAFRVYEMMGAIAGVAVGLLWGLVALKEPVTRPPSHDDVGPESR
jgi:hypothetical protein